MEQLTNSFKLFSDETTLRIMMLLLHQPLCVCQMTKITNVSQPNVSKKLAALRNANFVETKRRSKYTFYSLTIKDGIFIKLLNNINSNSETYTFFKEDLIGLESADTYIELNECN